MVDGNAGKGDKYRKTNKKKWDEGWELAFGNKKKKTNIDPTYPSSGGKKKKLNKKGKNNE